MRRKKHIEALFQKSESILSQIVTLHDRSKKDKVISEELKVEIMLFLVCLRAVLDYLSKEIIESNNITLPEKKLRGLYFPIRKGQKDFEKYISYYYPDLKSKNPRVYQYIEAIQPFKNASNEWLLKFNTLTNENKHDQLSPQIKKELKVLTFGENIHIISGPIRIQGSANVTIQGRKVTSDQTISYDSGPVKGEPGINESIARDIWEEIRLEAINEPVPEFLKVVYSNIEKIYKNISSLIK